MFITVSVGLVSAQRIPGNAKLLGELKVNFRAEKDELKLLKAGRFSSLIIAVDGNDVEIAKMVVVYGNGTKDEIILRHKFGENSRSRRIDLEGKKRLIRRIEFWYKTEGRLREGRADLQVYGIK